MEETLSTLDYAIRAKSIRNRPEVNQHLTKTGLLKEYLGDIERLKAEVLAAREKNGVYIPEDQWKEMQDDLAKQKSDYEEAKLRANAAGVELATKKRAFDELCTKMLATAEELELAREAEKQLGALVETVKGELEVSRQRLEEEKVVAEAYERGEERLDSVAIGLRNVATESVGDVGGLFDKLGELCTLRKQVEYQLTISPKSKGAWYERRRCYSIRSGFARSFQGPATWSAEDVFYADGTGSTTPVGIVNTRTEGSRGKSIFSLQVLKLTLRCPRKISLRLKPPSARSLRLHRRCHLRCPRKLPSGRLLHETFWRSKSRSNSRSKNGLYRSTTGTLLWSRMFWRINKNTCR